MKEMGIEPSKLSILDNTRNIVELLCLFCGLLAREMQSNKHANEGIYMNNIFALEYR